MIEFALLFGLGFLSATLIAMLLAPAIHRRIVRYTENRIRATLPISPQEVRAQRDMARAVYAAENARTKQELVRERDRNTDYQLKHDALIRDLKRLEAEKVELSMRIDQMDADASDVRSRLREGDSYIQELRAALAKAEEAETEHAGDVDQLRQQLLLLTSDADNFRIDLSTRDTEMENLRLRINTLRDERESLRNDLREQTTRASDAETRLAQEEERSARLDDKLSREIADRADKEVALERRVQEVGRLREKLGMPTVAADSAAAVAALPAAAPQPDEEEQELDGNIAALADDARHRATALSERLLNSKNTANDAALRQELAAIAAGMVALTAASEGKTSPIRSILSGRTGNGGRESLAARAKKVLTTIE